MFDSKEFGDTLLKLIAEDQGDQRAIDYEVLRPLVQYAFVYEGSVTEEEMRVVVHGGENSEELIKRFPLIDILCNSPYLSYADINSNFQHQLRIYKTSPLSP